MDLDLKEFGTTLAVGVFVVFGFLTLSYTFLDLSFLQAIAAAVRKRGTVGNIAGALLLAVAVLVCGIVGEDLSNKFVDSDYGKRFYALIFKTERRMRADTLFGQPRLPAESGLARELAASGRLSRYLANDWELEAAAHELEERILFRDPTVADDDVLERIASAIYYVAKNTVFAHEAFSRELGYIQIRVDFARSLATYMALFAAVGLACFALQSLRVMCPGWFRWCSRGASGGVVGPTAWVIPALTLPSAAEGTAAGVWRVLLVRALILEAFFVVGFWLTRAAYEAEEREFNIRAYGYFATLDEEELPKIASRDWMSVPTADLSGMAHWRSNLVVVVHDAKADLQPHRPRLGVLDLGTAPGRYYPVSVRWPGGQAPASDLEAVCAIPGHPEEFLAAESGYYQGRYGRLFRLGLVEAGRTARFRAVVIEFWQWPRGAEEIEGIACLPLVEGHLLVASRRDGRLAWGPLALGQAQGVIRFTGGRRLPPLVTNRLAEYSRLISELHVDRTGTLWAAAANEPPEGPDAEGLGPFRSAVYALGRLTQNPADPVAFLDPSASLLRLEGVKVEGLTAGVRREASFTVGTDDERLGGIWRLLPVNGQRPLAQEGTSPAQPDPPLDGPAG